MDPFLLLALVIAVIASPILPSPRRSRPKGESDPPYDVIMGRPWAPASSGRQDELVINPEAPDIVEKGLAKSEDAGSNAGCSIRLSGSAAAAPDDTGPLVAPPGSVAGGKGQAPTAAPWLVL